MPRMLSSLTRTPFVVALALTTTVAPVTADPGDPMNCDSLQARDAEARKIAETFHQWDAAMRAGAMRAGDVPGPLDLVTEDAELWTSWQPAFKGREALGAAFEPLFQAFELEQDFECEELIVAVSG